MLKLSLASIALSKLRRKMESYRNKVADFYPAVTKLKSQKTINSVPTKFIESTS